MPDVEGQWDFYPNLTLKIKHTLSARESINNSISHKQTSCYCCANVT